MQNNIRRVLYIIASFAVAIIVLTGLPLKQVMASVNATSKRISGNDRYETAAQIAEAGWTATSDYAIVVTGDDFPDALCAAPLAKKYNAPIILTNKSSLNINTKAELQRLNVKNVIIVGGFGAVSQSTEKQIQDLNITTQRIAGNNRYETSEKIAEALGKSQQVAIATGVNFPDALSIAPIAASKGMPILLTAANSISIEIEPYLKSNTFTNSYVIGGSGVISDNVLSKLQNPERLNGNNRYDTNITVLNKFKSDLNFSNIFIATGDNFPDALACSALSAMTSSPLVLINSKPQASTLNYIHNNFSLINSVTAIGGTGVIPDTLVKNVLTDFGKYGEADEGNTVANLNNNGMFCTKNNSIYTNTLDSSYIIKTALDGSQKKWLNFQDSSFINVSNNYIFYISNLKIYRMNIDGTNDYCINSKDEATSLIYYNGYLYYINGSDCNRIYKMKTDGSGRARLSSDTPCSYLNITDQFIYYTVSPSVTNGSLYRISLDGSNRTLIKNYRCEYTIVDGNSIYFINGSDGNTLWSMNADGTGTRKLNDDNCSYLNISNGVLYYSNGNDRDKIYALKTDGSNRTCINNESSHYLNIVNGTIYYMTSGFDNVCHNTKTVDLDANSGTVDNYSLGNLPGNINNGAFRAYDGKYIYTLENGIYRYNPDNTNKTLVNQGSFYMTDINVVGDWIYYSTADPHYSYSGNERIYKVKADGTGGIIELSPNRAFNMTVVGDWIYYTTEEYDYNYVGAGPIHKVKTDGTGEAYLDIKNFDYATCLNFAGDYIYYINTKDNMKIYRIKTDGTGREKIVDEPANQLNVSNGYMYYISQTDYTLKKASVDGGTPVTIKSGNIYNSIVTDDKIYYVNLEKIYSCNLDGSGETYITDCTINSPINIAGDYLYYEDTTDAPVKYIKIK